MLISIQAPISFVITSVRRQYSAVSDLRTALVKVWDRFRLWSVQQHNSAHLSIICKDSSDIHWGLGVQVFDGGGAYLAPSGLGTRCAQGLVVPLGVVSRGRRGVISGIPHGSELVFTIAVHVMQSDRTQNSSDPLSSLSQIYGGQTQRHSLSVTATIFLIGPDITFSCGGSAAADRND